MVTAIEIVSEQSYVPALSIPVGDVGGPLHIRNATGLGPVAATVNTVGYSNLDGEFYNGSKVGKRNIVLTVGLDVSRGDESVSEARKLLYAYLMPKTNVIVRIISTDHPPLVIGAVVESNENDRFSQDVQHDISLISQNPNFVNPELTSITGESRYVDPEVVEFESHGDKISFTNVILSATGQPYSGRVIFEIRAVDSVDWRRYVVDNVLLDSDWSLTVDSHIGQKVVQVEGPETPVNMLGNLADESLWIYVAPGINQFRVRTHDADDAPTVRNWALSFNEQYGAV